MGGCGDLRAMRNLFLWYLPQAAIFCGTIYFAIETDPQSGSPPMTGGAIVGSGVMIAAVYTAAVMVARDAPLHYRGIGLWGRRFFGALLLCILGLAAWGAVEAFRMPTASVIAAPFILGALLLLWAMILGLWHSFTVRSPSHRRARSQDGPR